MLRFILELSKTLYSSSIYIGHLRKLEMAVKMIKHPSDREVAIIKAKAAIDDLPKQKLDDNENGKLEFDFWQELKTQVLEPDSEEYEEVSISDQMGCL